MSDVIEQGKLTYKKIMIITAMCAAIKRAPRIEKQRFTGTALISSHDLHRETLPLCGYADGKPGKQHLPILHSSVL